MSRYRCVYYQTRAGRIPVKEFVDSLHGRTQHKFFNVVILLEEYGKNLPRPHAQYIADDIFELRFVGIEGGVRIFYFFFHENKVVLSNGFIKKTRKAPKREIELAKERKKAYLANTPRGDRS